MENKFLWWRDGIIYQIYPRSFADANNDGIGDLEGIVTRLDYLKDLGIDAIWLSPVNPSPDVDFGYDVSNYHDIDPKYGSLASFDRLVQEAHSRGIRIILDLVLNHTSDQHPWFIESRKTRDNPYRDYYLWRDPLPNGNPPNNWLSVFGGDGWELDPATGQMYFHMFCKEQPDVNWRNPAVRKAMLDVFRFWLERGVDGFRLDVFNVYFKNPELKDNPTKLIGLRGFDRMNHTNDMDQPDMIPLLQEIRALLDSYGERYAVGETFLGGAEKAALYCGDNLLHATFDFEFLQSSWWARSFFQAIQHWEQALGSTWPNYVLNNHDVSRSATRFTHNEDDNRLKCAAALLLTMRGTPFLYYGEEIGMRDIKLTREQIKDPVGKRYWPIVKGRDGCRSPMQWNAGPNAGFTQATVEPWLPLHPDFSSRNVVAQQDDPESLLNFYKNLIALRKTTPALRSGMLNPITYGTRFLLAYLRQLPDQTVLVALNFSGRRQRLVLGRQLANTRWKLLLSSKRTSMVDLDSDIIILEPNEAILLQQV